MHYSGKRVFGAIWLFQKSTKVSIKEFEKTNTRLLLRSYIALKVVCLVSLSYFYVGSGSKIFFSMPVFQTRFEKP